MIIGFPKTYQNWARWSLFNLLIVAMAGVIIRSKIIFPLPFIHQKNLLHAHSHFAFSGWVSAALMASIIALVYPGKPVKKMVWVFYAQMIASYGMLFTFPFMGYKFPSIFFSTITIATSFLFCFFIWKPLSILPSTVSIWFRTALVCNLISSLGTFMLAYLMSAGSHSQELTIGSLYFFLHFQYNGWFFFSCAGLFFQLLHICKVYWPEGTIRLIWLLFTMAVVPGFFLSALWMNLPGWMYWMAVFAALIQLPAIFLFLKEIFLTMVVPGLRPLARYCLLLSLTALTIKYVLQVLSCLPSLSIYAFGYRSLVIAFLHLVLLGFVTLFILGYFIQAGLMPGSEGMKRGLYIFSGGIILNEAILMIQGLGAIGFISIPYTNEILWLISLVMFSGILIINRRYA